MTMEQAKNTHHWGKDHCTACLQFYKFGSSCFTTYNKQHIFSALTRLYLTKQKKICCLDVCSKAVESKLVKLETTRTVIMPPPNGECSLGEVTLYQIVVDCGVVCRV